MYLSVHLFIWPTIFSSVHLFIWLYVYLYISSFLFVFFITAYMSFCLHVNVSSFICSAPFAVRLLVHLIFFLPIYLPLFFLSISLSVHIFESNSTENIKVTNTEHDNSFQNYTVRIRLFNLNFKHFLLWNNYYKNLVSLWNLFYNIGSLQMSLKSFMLMLKQCLSYEYYDFIQLSEFV